MSAPGHGDWQTSQPESWPRGLRRHATVVIDDALFLERGSHRTDAGPANTQHVAENLLGQWKTREPLQATVR